MHFTYILNIDIDKIEQEDFKKDGYSQRNVRQFLQSA